MHKHHATLNNRKVDYGDGVLCFLFVFEKLAFGGVVHRTYHFSYHLRFVYCSLQNHIEVIRKSEFARGPGGSDICHLSNLDETLPD